MQHVIITGGSSGIGLAIARLCVERGCRVSLIARRAALLNEAQSALENIKPAGADTVFATPADVKDRASIEDAVTRCEEKFGHCDLLITSAGQVEPRGFDETSADLFNAQINTNLLGTANSIRAVYQRMLARGSGQIMVISSAAASIGIHGYSAYCASKSALTGFVEALRSEAKPHGIQISIAFPPDTLTPQYRDELPKRSFEANALMGKVKPWPPARVARKIMLAADNRAATVHFGYTLKMLYYFGPVVKPILYWLADRRAQQMKGR